MSEIFYHDGVEIRQSLLYPTFWASADGRVLGPRGKWLSPRKTGTGYHQVSTLIDGKAANRKIHRIVGSAWCDGHSIKFNEIDHINHDKTDNRAINLRWVDRMGNMANREQMLCKTPYNRADGWYVEVRLGPFFSEAEALEAGKAVILG